VTTAAEVFSDDTIPADDEPVVVFADLVGSDLVPLSVGQVPVLIIDGDVRIAFRHAVQAIGLDYRAALRLIRARSWARGVVTTTRDRAGRQSQMVTVDRRTFLMFLAAVNENRVRADVRPALVAFQREAADVLDAYVSRGVAVNPRGRTPGQIELIETAAAGLVGPVLEHLNRAHFAQQVVDGRRDETPEMSKPVARRRVGQHLARAYAAAVDAGLDARAALAEGATT